MTQCVRLAVIAMFLCAVSLANAAPITIRVDAPSGAINLGQSFSVDLRADIADPVIAWGLDVLFDNSIVSLTTSQVGPAWFPASSLDGDDLAGLAFPSALIGPDVLLATLTFQVLSLGATNIIGGITPSDPTEGFALEAGGFADLVFIGRTVTVTSVPEPHSVLLIVTGALGLVLSRRRACRQDSERSEVGRPSY